MTEKEHNERARKELACIIEKLLKNITYHTMKRKIHWKNLWRVYDGKRRTKRDIKIIY